MNTLLWFKRIVRFMGFGRHPYAVCFTFISFMQLRVKFFVCLIFFTSLFTEHTHITVMYHFRLPVISPVLH